jgi:hypothetical protein
MILLWPDHLTLPGIRAQANAYALQNFRSFQGQKDAGYYWYTLLKAYLKNIGFICPATDHAVFVWKNMTAKLFMPLATEYFLMLTDNIPLFLSLNTCL